ncbi:hypothetical protein AAFF_G00273310 [Aldrovandia affinis]|uniref:Amelotin n=1 Tax=Aldrovandia affinis TaxID=143900 RepID=A0AAD7WT81_9TELE|nr:hypothetical protein AAFF_G00273310 [Aldrovandia affinis]
MKVPLHCGRTPAKNRTSKMICILIFIIQTCAYLVDAGGSGSAEAAAAMNGGMMNGGMGADGAKPGTLNNLLLNGQTQLAQLVPISPTLFIQQPGLPFGQIAVPVGNNMALQQGGMTLPQQAQQGVGIPQGTQFFAILPANSVGGLQIPGMQVPGVQMFNPAQQFQIVPLGAGNMMQQQAMGAQTAGNAVRRVKHSVPAEPNPTTATSETQENPSVPTTRPMSLAKALKLPLFASKVNPTDPECSEPEPAIPEREREIPTMSMEESSGSGAVSWTEMIPRA